MSAFASDARTLIVAGTDALQAAAEKRGKEVEYQIAAAQAAGVLALAAAAVDVADALRSAP